VFLDHSWPGNVRQLQALVKQMVLTAESKAISPEMVMAALDRYHPGMAKSDGQYWNMTWSKALETFEGDYFKRRLSENSGSMSALARELGMTRPNLYLKIKKYGLKTARE
jgi:DNA-binding NtrC family response regulator